MQVSCIVAMMLFLLLAAIKPQMHVTEEYEGAAIHGYQALPLAQYMILSGLLIGITLWKGGLKGKRSGICAVLSLLAMPAASFYIFETVAGNFWTIMNNRAGLVLLNLVIWYLLYALVFAVSNRVRLSVLIVNTVAYLFAVANAFVVQFRKEPIMVMDIKSFWTAVSVAGDFLYEPTVNMVLMGLLAIFCNLWIIKMDFKLPGIKSRLCYAAVMIGCAWYAFYGMLAGDFFEKAGSAGLDFFRFNLTYQTDGYMASTVKCLRFIHVEEPEGYSADRVRALAEELEEEKPKEKNLPQNIIVIMNESFSDLSVLGDFKTSQPVLPYLDSMEGNVTRGLTYVSVYGGGTANSEFEFLTGNSVAYIPAGTVAYQVYVEEGDSSLAEILKKNGYRTVAYHPYLKENYNRPAVYKIYGFDEYYGRDDIKHKKIRKYASDKSDYQNLIQLYEDKTPGEKLFLFNITMQNHGGYDYENYESDVLLTDYLGEFPQTEQFLSLMRKSDEAFHELIEYFSKVEEDTVILLFGDHQPRLEDEFYERVQGPETPENYLSRYQNTFLTPYVIWANCDLDIESREYTSVNFLGSYFLDAIGIELPAYNRYLLQLQDEIPAINVNGFLDREYVMHGLSEEGEYQEMLQEYRMFEYNNLFDKRNRIKELFE